MKGDKEHMARIAELGCIICGMPAEVHHIGRQGGQRGKGGNPQRDGGGLRQRGQGNLPCFQ